MMKVTSLLDTLLSDCTAPFQIDVFTDALDDLGDTAGTNTALSRGKQ